MARTNGHGNAKWTRDETLLALNLYFQNEGKVPTESDASVMRLSLKLQTMGRGGEGPNTPTYRNPAGVVFKLQNIRQLATGKGLAHVSQMDRAVWNDYGRVPDVVEQLAANIEQLSTDFLALDTDDDLDEEFSEGRLLSNLHLRRERSASLRKRVIRARRRVGPLQCEICNSQAKVMGELGDAQFEVHHIVPLNGGLTLKTRLTDASLLCANCHRIIHRAIRQFGRWIGISEARELLSVGPSAKQTTIVGA